MFAYDLAANVRFAICTAEGRHIKPSIGGSVVVWEDNRNASSTHTDVYGVGVIPSPSPATVTDPTIGHYRVSSWSTRVCSGGISRVKVTVARAGVPCQVPSLRMSRAVS